MIVDTGLNIAVQALSDDMSDGQLGTGTTAPSASDTDLETGVAATDATLSDKTVTNQTLTNKHTTNSGTGNGSTMSEFGSFTSADVLINRSTFTPLAKTSSDEIIVFTKVVIDRA